jgi:hypothetical protein
MSGQCSSLKHLLRTQKSIDKGDSAHRREECHGGETTLIRLAECCHSGADEDRVTVGLYDAYPLP